MQHMDLLYKNKKMVSENCTYPTHTTCTSTQGPTVNVEFSEPTAVLFNLFSPLLSCCLNTWIHVVCIQLTFTGHSLDSHTAASHTKRHTHKHMYIVHAHIFHIVVHIYSLLGLNNTETPIFHDSSK